MGFGPWGDQFTRALVNSLTGSQIECSSSGFFASGAFGGLGPSAGFLLLDSSLENFLPDHIQCSRVQNCGDTDTLVKLGTSSNFRMRCNKREDFL